MRAGGMDPASLGLAATDLANHLACRHLTQLDLAAAQGRLEPPRWWRPGLDALRERGIEHERAYLAHLESTGLHLTRPGESEGVGIEWTREAMRAGVEVIVQAPLGSGRWSGRADVLRRVERPSALGAWSYEALDTKLARETRAGTILQLALYSDLLGEIQGAAPEFMHVVTPRTGFAPERYRVEEYVAYYRWVKRRLECAVETSPVTYPEPVPHCDLCRWWPRCDEQRRRDDHLSLVAGITRLQRRELESHEVVTLEALARVPRPLPWTPKRGTRDGYRRVREQARVQLEARRDGGRVVEWLEPAPEQGLARLPQPSRGDLFLDLEGDPYVSFSGNGSQGVEYLFGLASLGSDGAPIYECVWATTPAEEKAAFERVVDTMLIHWERDPDLHVFHYGAYDAAALKRLMGRHATREREVDRMLRAGRFVDLLPVVRQSLRASVEHYSIKDLELFYGFERVLPLRDAARGRAALEQALELGTIERLGDQVRQSVEAYNRDDCVSAMKLRQWLESARASQIEQGASIERPIVPESGEPKPDLDERERRAQALAAQLAADVPVDTAERTAEQRARLLLANLVEWHRREEKAPWWDYFRLRDLSDEELMDEKPALAGLQFLERVADRRRRSIERYAFPPQESSVREGDELHARDFGKVGEVIAIDPIAGEVQIRRSGGVGEPTAVFEHSFVSGRAMADALFRLGEWVAGHGVDSPGPWRAGRDLLLHQPPRLRAGATLEGDDSSVVAAARRVALALDHGVLVIQGPPGAGKTFTAARMICDLVRAGRKVGVSAQSHKVIRNLLDTVFAAAREASASVVCLHKVKELADAPGPVAESSDNDEVRQALAEGAAQVVGGTVWLWSRPEFHEAVDVLFVDEAGQMSLANVLAASQGAKSLVLVGDPQQLEQPIQGSHPDGAAVSALDHVLAGHKTLPRGRGLFLDETWRLHPAICEFTSQVFYESRLRPRRGLERQALEGPLLSGAGLWLVPVEHRGNQSSSAEEVAVVASLVESLTRGATTWVDREGARRAMGLEDVLVLAPYNAQVADLIRALPQGARVGTVDRFQGQEAPVVIVSMTTSAPEDAPRGMEFLYSLNRLNVATSRAQGACILVASPRLFEPDCQSPRQMRLANALCRYLEMAKPLQLQLTASTT